MYTPRLGVLGLHKRTLAAVAAVGIVALLALAASMALMQPATVAPKGGTADSVGLKGIVDIVVKDANGNVKYQKTLENAIQDSGLQKLLEYSFKATSTEDKWFDVIKLDFFDSTPSDAGGPKTFSTTVEDTAAELGGVVVSQVATGKWQAVIEVPILIAEDRTATTVTCAWDATAAKYKITVGTASDGYTLPVYVDKIYLQDETTPTPVTFSVLDIANIGLNAGDSLTITWTIYAQAPT